MQRSVLEYRNYRYLKASSLLMALAIAAYLLHQPATGSDAYGGTWLGYVLGILSAFMAIALLVYGVRKRLTPMIAEQRDTSRPSSIPPENAVGRRKYDPDWLRRHGGMLQGWLSVHIYMGISLIVLVTLHTGFQFGWDVHTLSYFLMMAVILSGCYGIYAYLRFPRLMTENMDGRDTFSALMQEIEDLDKQAGVKSLQFSDEICELVHRARQETLIGGNFFQQLMAYHHKCPTAQAVKRLQVLGKNLEFDQIKAFDDLYVTMAHKEALVRRARRDVMYRARMEFWLYLHAPLSMAFLASLVAHVVAIFYYW
jgi:hypothetical protein